MTAIPGAGNFATSTRARARETKGIFATIRHVAGILAFGLTVAACVAGGLILRHVAGAGL